MPDVRRVHRCRGSVLPNLRGGPHASRRCAVVRCDADLPANPAHAGEDSVQRWTHRSGCRRGTHPCDSRERTHPGVQHRELHRYACGPTDLSMEENAPATTTDDRPAGSARHGSSCGRHQPKHGPRRNARRRRHRFPRRNTNDGRCRRFSHDSVRARGRQGAGRCHLGGDHAADA